MAAKNSRRFEFKLGKTGMIVFILGLSVLVFFSFVFGVMVGKHIEAYPEKLARGVPAMIKEQLGLSSVQDEPAINTPTTDSKAVEATKKDFDLTFYDTLGGKKGSASVSIAGNEKEKKLPTDGIKQPAQAQANVEMMATKPSTAAATKVENPVAAVSPPATGTDKRILSQVPGDVSIADMKKDKGKYLIQVVSFRERTKADTILKKITAMGYKPQIVAANLPGKGRWFRVILAGYNSRQDAQKISDKVAKSVSGVNCVVVSE